MHFWTVHTYSTTSPNTVNELGYVSGFINTKTHSATSIIFPQFDTKSTIALKEKKKRGCINFQTSEWYPKKYTKCSRDYPFSWKNSWRWAHDTLIIHCICLVLFLEKASMLEPATQLPTAVPYTAFVNWIMLPIEAHLKAKQLIIQSKNIIWDSE
jgi:hypothetical protein